MSTTPRSQREGERAPWLPLASPTLSSMRRCSAISTTCHAVRICPFAETIVPLPRGSAERLGDAVVRDLTDDGDLDDGGKDPIPDLGPDLGQGRGDAATTRARMSATSPAIRTGRSDRLPVQTLGSDRDGTDVTPSWRILRPLPTKVLVR